MNEAAAHAAAMAEKAARDARQRANDLGSVLNRSAVALVQSAKLADAYAARQSQTGRARAAAEERLAARRAHEASRVARAHAVRCLEMGTGRMP